MAHSGFLNGIGISEAEVFTKLGIGLFAIEKNKRLIGECNYQDKKAGIAEIGIKYVSQLIKITVLAKLR